MLPDGTGITWEYSTGSTGDPLVPAEEEDLPNLATSVVVRALLTGSAANDTPVLNFKDVNLVGYLNHTRSVYISRENELAQGVASTKVYAQMNVPSGTSVEWHGTSNGATWGPHDR